jgi:toxic protein SymE
MLKSDIAARIRAIFLHDGSAVAIVDFIILLGWSISTFEAAVKWRVITIEDPASDVPRISHAQLLEKAREQWSEAEIAEALGNDGLRVLASTQAPAAVASFIHDAVRADPVDALQLVGAPSPAGMLAAGLRPPHREPVPRRRTRTRVPAIAPAPPLPPTRRNRADGVREATLTGFEVAYRDLVPMLRLRGRWLARNGFTVGARIYITVAEGRIVITATDPAASAAPARAVALREVAGALAVRH